MKGKTSTLFIYMGAIFLFLGLTRLPVRAQNQPVLIRQEKGTVFGGNPAVYTFTAKVNTLRIIVDKIEGRAKVEANIYIDGQLQTEKTLRFTEGKQLLKRTSSLALQPGQKVKIEIINLSVGKKFQYEVLVHQ